VSATLTCYVVIIIIRRLITRAMSEYMATSESNVVRGVPLTVKHIVECSNLQNVRNKYYSVSSLRDLSVSVDNHNIIDFIKETHFTTVCNVCYFTLYISSIALILCLPFYLCLLFSHHVSLMALNGLLGLCTDVPLRNDYSLIVTIEY